MILHVASTAPVAARLLADTALAFHIAGGTAGLAAGAVAMVAKKGGRLHRLAGEVFFFAMLAMSGVGAVVAPMIDDIGSAIAGAVTVYLVITGGRAGRSPVVTGGAFEVVAVTLLGGAIAFMLWMGRLALLRPTHAVADVPWFAFFVIAAIATLIGALDLKLVLGPPLSGPPRLARHVWRMGLALLIALMSALAQAKVGGAIFHGSALQWVPVAALGLSLAYWMARVRRPRLFKAAPLAAPIAATVSTPVQGALS